MRFKKKTIHAGNLPNGDSDMAELPEFPSIESRSYEDEWFLLEQYNDGLIEDEIGETLFEPQDFPKTLNLEIKSNTGPDKPSHIPEIPTVDSLPYH
jgi:hypothetical protein